MSKVMDWILSKMRLVDTEEVKEIEEEYEEPGDEPESIEKRWMELVHRKKEKEPKKDGCVYFKNVQTYEDCKLVIDNYKKGAVCVYCLYPAVNPDAQGLMNYLCGALYALDGEVSAIGENVYIASARTEREFTEWE